MSVEPVKRKILQHIKDFREFFKEYGPFRYALTSAEFPPVLLEPEEWIFSNDIKALLKSLMQFNEKKMKMVKVPFNPDNKSILRPGNLSSWKINNFPEEWNACTCDFFVPEGHLTRAVLDKAKIPEKDVTAEQVEEVFFQCLASQMDRLGYYIFLPRGSSKCAEMEKYLVEWEEDEQDAGLF